MRRIYKYCCCGNEKCRLKICIINCFKDKSYRLYVHGSHEKDENEGDGENTFRVRGLSLKIKNKIDEVQDKDHLIDQLSEITSEIKDIRSEIL